MKPSTVREDLRQKKDILATVPSAANSRQAFYLDEGTPRVVNDEKRGVLLLTQIHSMKRKGSPHGQDSFRRQKPLSGVPSVRGGKRVGAGGRGSGG